MKFNTSFWTAFQGIVTLLGILIALFLPFIREYSQNNKIERLRKAELKEDYAIIKEIAKAESLILKGGPKDGLEIPASQRTALAAPHIKADLWNSFKYQLASVRPSSFALYSSLYKKVDGIVDPKTEDPKIKFAMQTVAAEEFVKIYESELEK